MFGKSGIKLPFILNPEQNTEEWQQNGLYMSHWKSAQTFPCLRFSPASTLTGFHTFLKNQHTGLIAGSASRDHVSK